MITKENVDLSYESIKDKVVLRLVEIKRNRDFLEDRPYMCLGNGMAMVLDIQLRENEDGVWRATIDRGMAERFEYDLPRLFRDAMDHAWEIEPPVMKDMEAALFGLAQSQNLLVDGTRDLTGQEVAPRMYVLSNRDGVLGASVLYYPDIQERVAEVLGESYSVLPSSIHEVLVVPDSAGISAKDLNHMVRGANEYVVDAKDVLSDKVFHYDKEDKQFCILRPENERAEWQAQRAEAR